jgi:polysaccharide deacetylase family protein (PEP-CTERM system associated)
VVEEATGLRCAGYRAPSFSLRRSDTWAWEALADAGIRYDSSVFPVVHDRYGEPDAPRGPFTVSVGDRAIREFPLSTVRLAGRNLPVAGGGYLRLYPLGVTRWAIRRLEAEGLPAIVYLHPWEMDPDQPIPPAHWLRVWRHRVGMKRLMSKLDRLLQLFRFGPFREWL